MKKKYVIANMRGKILSFLLDENGHALEIHCDGGETGSQEFPGLGEIYIGRVQSVVKNIRAAFVEIKPGAACYLPLEDAEPGDTIGELAGTDCGDPGRTKAGAGSTASTVLYTRKGPSPRLQQGDELAVQISREAIKSKAPAVTTRLSFSGKYGILDLGRPGVGVSRKLPEPERERLRELGTRFLETIEKENSRESQAEPKEQQEQFWKLPGIVLRTNAAAAEDAEILEELEQLYARLKHIEETARYRTCYSCLYRPASPWLKRLLSLPLEDLEAIRIQDEGLYQQAAEFIGEQIPALTERLIRYQDDLLPMEKLFSLERELESALSERVWLPSGAYLVIQPTEALTVIDVNTGKCGAGRQKEETVRKVNLEAAKETARQLRLRNLSGIILVDFINMGQEASRQQVMDSLRKLLAMDPVQAHVVDITRLGLVEITRKKLEKPLYEEFFV